MRPLRWCLLVAVSAACSGLTQAQVFSPGLEVIPWHVRAEPELAPPGGVVRIVFQGSLGESDDGPWRVYAMDSPLPTRAVNISLNKIPSDVEPSGDVEQWGEEKGFDEWFGKTVSYFKGKALLWLDFGVNKGSEEGVKKIGGTITFMACNDRKCLPPAVLPFDVSFEIDRDAESVLPPTPPQYIADLTQSIKSLGKSRFNK